MFRNVASKVSASAFSPLGGPGQSPLAKTVAFGIRVQVVPIASRAAPCFSTYHKGTHDVLRLDDSAFLDRKGEDSINPARVMRQGTIVIRTLDGRELPILPAPPTLLQVKRPQPTQQPTTGPVPEGTGQQLVKLPPNHEFTKSVLTDPSEVGAAIKQFDLRYDLEKHTPTDFWRLLDQIPFKDRWMYSPTSFVNQLTEAQGRKGEWDGPIVVLAKAPAGTRMVQIVTDALQVVPMGRGRRPSDSQAFALARAMSEGAPGPLGRYLLVCAPTSPEQAADYAAILNVWKEICSHVLIVELTDDVLMKFGQIGKQEDSAFNAQTGQLERVERRGGALQASPVHDADIRTKMKPLKIIQLYGDEDLQTVAALLKSGQPGGVQVRQLMEHSDSQGFDSHLPAGLDAGFQKMSLILNR